MPLVASPVRGSQGDAPIPHHLAALAEPQTVSLGARGATVVRRVGGPRPGARAAVLLHGLTATADLNWHATYGPLAAAGFDVVAPDLRGHGDGPAAGRFRLSDGADDVAALVAALGLGPVVLVGFSLGGAVALATWQRHPAVVAGLVLCAPAVGHREVSLRARLVDRPARRLVAEAGHRLPPPVRARLTPRLAALSRARLQAGVDATDPAQGWAAAELARSDPFEVAAVAVALRGAAVRVGPVDGDRTVPVSVVVTDRDEVVPTARQLELLAQLPPGTTEHHVAGGHGAFVEEPERFAAAVVEATSSVATRRGTPHRPTT